MSLDDEFVLLDAVEVFGPGGGDVMALTIAESTSFTLSPPLLPPPPPPGVPLPTTWADDEMGVAGKGVVSLTLFEC